MPNAARKHAPSVSSETPRPGTSITSHRGIAWIPSSLFRRPEREQLRGMRVWCGVVMLLTVGCRGETPHNSTVVQKIPVVVGLRGSVIREDGLLGTPTDVAVLGGYLLVVDASLS